jgi:hypothetical protein
LGLIQAAIVKEMEQDQTRTTATTVRAILVVTKPVVLVARNFMMANDGFPVVLLLISLIALLLGIVAKVLWQNGRDSPTKMCERFRSADIPNPA